jgi:hypothetical protein
VSAATEREMLELIELVRSAVDEQNPYPRPKGPRPRPGNPNPGRRQFQRRPA